MAFMPQHAVVREMGQQAPSEALEYGGGCNLSRDKIRHGDPRFECRSLYDLDLSIRIWKRIVWLGNGGVKKGVSRICGLA